MSKLAVIKIHPLFGPRGFEWVVMNSHNKQHIRESFPGWPESTYAFARWVYTEGTWTPAVHNVTLFRKMVKQGNTTCEGCFFRWWVNADPRGTSSSGWGCVKTGGHAIKRCKYFTTTKPCSPKTKSKRKS